MATLVRKFFVLVLLLIILPASDETVKNTEAIQIGDCTELIGGCTRTPPCVRKCKRHGCDGGKCSLFLCLCNKPCPP
ncbi:unnamed protein product [Malus baccata var. baccata]